MTTFKNKISIILMMNFSLLVLLLSRFNNSFIYYEYRYEPLFVLNITILFFGFFSAFIMNKKLGITIFEKLVYVLTLWLIISLFLNFTEHSINGINVGSILNIIIPMLFVTFIYFWKNQITKINIVHMLGFMVTIAALLGMSAILSVLFPDMMISLLNSDLNDISRATISPIKNGSFLALFIIPSISLFIYNDKKNIRFFYLFCFILILLGLIATGRRGSYFPAIIGVIIFFSILLYYNFNIKGLKKYLKYFVIISLSFLLFSIYLLDSGQINRLFGQSDTESSDRGRVERMESAIELIMEKPIIGDGVGNYYYRVEQGDLSGIKSVSYDSWLNLNDPHNMYLMILAESGIIGLFIFLIILIYVLKRLKPKDIISLGIFLGVLVFLLNGIVETRLWKSLVRLDTVFWMLVGMGIVYNYKLKYNYLKKNKM